MLKYTNIKSISLTPSVQFLRNNSFWSHVEKAPPDKILGLSTLYNNDQNPKKVNLGVGAYRDGNGKPWILPSIRSAEGVLHRTEVNKEYIPITGSINFNKLIKNLLYSNDKAGKLLLDSNRVFTSQGLSGTGSLRVLTEFISKFHYSKNILVPNPTWANHIAICEKAGLKPNKYRYYDYSKNSLDLNGLLEDLNKAEPGTVVLLHVCCHNPTGIDPDSNDWDKIIEVLSKKKLLPLLDMAYQGFRSGSPIKDLEVLFKFNESVIKGKLNNFLLAQSFAKNMGLYGERVGSLSIVTANADETINVKSQIEKIIRPMYSSPPCHGSKLVEIVLSNDEIYQQWLKDVNVMAERLIKMRHLLFKKLTDLNNPLNWDHLINQKGMFCFTGLNEEQVKQLISKSIYLTNDGRISIAGICEENVDYLAESINSVTK